MTTIMLVNGRLSEGTIMRRMKSKAKKCRAECYEERYEIEVESEFECECSNCDGNERRSSREWIDDILDEDNIDI